MMVPLVYILVFLSLCYTATSQPLWVSTTGSDTDQCGASPATACLTLGHTISNRASASAQIYMLPGTYVRENTEVFLMFKELNISGFDSSATAVRVTCDGSDKKLVFKSIPRIFLSNLTITDCHSQAKSANDEIAGGAVTVSHSGLNLRNVIVANSTSTAGPGLGNGGCLAATMLSSVVIKNSTFFNCTTTGRGGGLYIDDDSTGDLEVCQHHLLTSL